MVNDDIVVIVRQHRFGGVSAAIHRRCQTRIYKSLTSGSYNRVFTLLQNLAMVGIGSFYSYGSDFSYTMTTEVQRAAIGRHA